jgi:uncharacterized membrane protein
MLDWIGSLRLRESTPLRVDLSLSRSTQIAGWVLIAAGAYVAHLVWPVAHWLALAPALVAGLGLVLATLQRRLVFDREAGVMRIEQRALGLGNRSVVPLFHLRAVVIAARPDEGIVAALRERTRTRFVAYVDRRVGDAIYLDESRHCAELLRLGEAIAEVAELRLEYDAMAR